MSYEQAIAVVGDEPAWLLKEWLERYPRGSAIYTAARVLLRRRVAP